MRVVIQKVKSASVTVNENLVGKINNGLLLLVGYEHEDSENDILWITQKVINMREFIFTSESVSEGHPDKICDQISDAIVDYYLAHSAIPENARVACETMVTTNKVFIAGEVRGDGELSSINKNKIEHRKKNEHRKNKIQKDKKPERFSKTQRTRTLVSPG